MVDLEALGPYGYGLMGLTWTPSPRSKQQCFRAMKTALENGASFWDGGEYYGPPEYNSLHLLRDYFEENPGDASKVTILIKGGLEKGTVKPDGSAQNTRRSIDESLRVLGDSKSLDIWGPARPDPKTPIEITMRTANEYVRAGKIGGICLSECSANTIVRAVKETKIAAVEVEFSLWSTQILGNDVAKVCAELDIPIIAYSPLGRGFLTGQIRKTGDIPEGDLRRNIPRFYAENVEKNLGIVHKLEELASKKGCKPGQLALAWLHAQGKKPGIPFVIPIPGSSNPERIKENLYKATLTNEELAEVDELPTTYTIIGGRYSGAPAALEHGDTPPLENNA